MAPLGRRLFHVQPIKEAKLKRARSKRKKTGGGDPVGKKIPGESGLRKLNPAAAGIDVGSREHYVAVPADLDPTPIRKFSCLTAQLHEMAQWLKGLGIVTVALESTGVYWIPVADVLESYGLDVQLVNARHVKNVPGRKTDVQDCRWLQELHSFGLLRGSFRPEAEVRVLRGYWRQRQRLVESMSQCILLMHKEMEQMNLQLGKVLSDVSGLSGMKIIRAILAGERDGKALAQLAHPGVRSERSTIAQALIGTWKEEHLFALKQHVALYDFNSGLVAECDHNIEECMKSFDRDTTLPPTATDPEKPNKHRRSKNAPQFTIRDLLHQMTGVDLTRIDGISTMTAQTIIAEIGVDMRAFPSEKHFSSWLGLCPNRIITGGKVKKSATRKVVNRVATALRRAASSLHRGKSWMGAFYRKMKARLGPPGAITAVAHKLACQVYRMLKYGGDYVDKGEKVFEERHSERELRYIEKRAKAHGYDLSPSPLAKAVP